MTNSINTDGQNFPNYLPKVGAGDRPLSSHINDLSSAVMRNSVTKINGGFVSRTSAGTSINIPSQKSGAFPFRVSCKANGSGLQVYMYIGNVWSGKNKKGAANLYHRYGSASPEVPIGKFDTDIVGIVLLGEYPPYYSWPFDGGNKVVYIEADADPSVLPKLKYAEMSVYEDVADNGMAIPIAYIDQDGVVLQIVESDIWLDPFGLRESSTHPFKVSFSSSGHIRVEQGSVFSYPTGFVDIMSTQVPNASYPFAIKRGASMGGAWHVNDGQTWSVSSGDYVYLQFTRAIANGGTYSGTAAGDVAWSCTINIGALPASSYFGNYNTAANATCGPNDIPNCGSQWQETQLIDNGYGPIAEGVAYLYHQAKSVKLLSWGTMVYPIAKIKTENTMLSINQYLRSDFFFYPPMDAHFGFDYATFSGSTNLEANTGLEPNP